MASLPSEHPSIDTLISQLKEFTSEVQSANALTDTQSDKIRGFLENNKNAFNFYAGNGATTSPLKGNLESLEDKIRAKFDKDENAVGVANKILDIRKQMTELPRELRIGIIPIEDRKLISVLSDEEKIQYINNEKLQLREVVNWKSRTAITADVLEFLKNNGKALKYLDLTGFDLSDAAMQQIVQYCPNVESLVVVDFKDNHGNYIPKAADEKLTNEGIASIKNLKNLKSLTIQSHEGHRNFPAELYDLSKLEELTLYAFYPLPDGIGKLEKLKELHLTMHSHAKIPDKLPNDFRSLINLEVLDLLSNDNSIDLDPALSDEQITKLKSVSTYKISVSDQLIDKLGPKLELRS